MVYSQNLYNPMYQTQQRLMQLEQQAQQPMQMSGMNNGLICNQVTNIQEAQAYQVPLGAIGVFVDLSTSKIYVKKPLGMDGRPEFNVYTLEQSKDSSSDIESRVSVLEKDVEALKKKKKAEVKDAE